MTLLERWEQKVEKGPSCWLWTGAFYGSGYGVIRDETSKRDGAHRVSFRLHKGLIPLGLHVLHIRTCPTKACVNPDHLYAGTRSENIQDCLAVGGMHTARGEKAGKSILSEVQVLQIRKDPRTPRLIAEELGLAKTTVYYAKTGQTWAHVGGV